MDGGKDEQRDGRREGRTDRGTEGRTDGGTDGRRDRRTDGGKDGRTEGRTDGRKDGRMDGGTEGGTDGQRAGITSMLGPLLGAAHGSRGSECQATLQMAPQWIPFPEAVRGTFSWLPPIPRPRYSFTTRDFIWNAPHTDHPLSGPPGCIPQHRGSWHLAGVRQGALQGCPPSGTHSLAGGPPSPTANKMGWETGLSRTKPVNGHEVAAIGRRSHLLTEAECDAGLAWMNYQGHQLPELGCYLLPVTFTLLPPTQIRGFAQHNTSLFPCHTRTSVPDHQQLFTGTQDARRSAKQSRQKPKKWVKHTCF